jgi:AcrR family transcriptional regulator
VNVERCFQTAFEELKMGLAERKNRERERRRLQIIVAANRVFLKNGYRNTRISDIAREAEISPGTVYLYFASKEELLLSLTLRMFQFLHMRLMHTMENRHRWPLEKRLAEVVEALLDAYQYDPQMMTFTLQIQGNEFSTNVSETISVHVKEQIRDIIERIADIIKGVSRETLHMIPPNSIAKSIWTQFTGAVMVNETLHTKLVERKEALNDDLRKWLQPMAMVFSTEGLTQPHGVVVCASD